MIVIPVNSWSEYKSTIIGDKECNVQYAETSGYYELYASEAMFIWTIALVKDSDDANDFEANYKANSNKPIKELVTTQFEKDDKDLKLARSKIVIAAGYGHALIPVPGTFGATGSGRWVAGGNALIDTWDGDDYIMVYVTDEDRLLAAAYGGLTDEQMIGQGDFPTYPIVKSYTDDELTLENQGWHFWPYFSANGVDPAGETEVDPIGGYGFIPAGFYLKITVTRSNPLKPTGTAYFDIFWGKKSSS